MKHPLAITIAAVLAATTIAGAAPFKPGRLPATTNWFLHLDFDSLRASDTGKELVSQLEEKKGAQFRAIKRMFSLNPLTDLGSVTLAGPGAKDVAVVLIEGRFDRAHIEDLIAAAKDYGTHAHGRVTVHSWTDEKKGRPQFGAFLNDRLVAVSDHQELLHDTLDTIAGKSPALESDPFFDQSGGAMLVAGWAHLARIEIDDEESQLLRKADELRISVGEDAGKLTTRLAVDAPDQHTAEQMRRALDGIAAFAELAEVVGPEVGLEVSLDKANQRAEAGISMPADEFLKFVEEKGILDGKDRDGDDDGK